MTVLVIGGSGSGKSEYAEREALILSGNEENPDRNKRNDTGKPGNCGRLIYLATMQNDGDEALRKIEKHRERRRGRGFFTLEWSRDIGSIDWFRLDIDPRESTILIESLSNLLANEMFCEEDDNVTGDIQEDSHRAELAVDRVYSDLWRISLFFKNTVIVSDDVFRDGVKYDHMTEEYMKALGDLHRKVADMSGRVMEVTAGEAVIIKNSPEKRKFLF